MRHEGAVKDRHAIKTHSSLQILLIFYETQLLMIKDMHHTSHLVIGSLFSTWWMLSQSLPRFYKALFMLL